MIRLEYTGPIPELQGKTALVRPAGDQFTMIKGPTVLAQFDDMDLKFNSQRMGYVWTPFPADHFTPITGKPVF